MNPLMKLLSTESTSKGGSDAIPMIKRMIGAAMSGESPQEFLNGLAQTDDRFKGMDFSNLEKTANEICGREKVSLSDAINKVRNGIPKIKLW